MQAATETLSIGIAASSVLIFLIATLKSSKTLGGNSIWQPEWLIAATFVYYIVAAPLTAIATNATVADQDFRDLIPITVLTGTAGLILIGAGIVLANIVFAHYQKRHQYKARKNKSNNQSIIYTQVVLSIILIIAAASWISTSSFVDIFILGNSESYQDAFENRNQITAALLSFAIPVCILQTIRPNSSRIITLTLIASTLILYLFIGTRIKILFLIGGVICAHHINTGKKLNPYIATAISVVFYSAFSIIGAYRVRYGGLDFEQDRTIFEVLTWGFRDGISVFFTFAKILEGVPAKIDYLYLEPIFAIPEYFVPRSLWPDKPEIATQLLVISQLIGTEHSREIGLAGPYFSDLHIIGGWPILLLGSLFFGMASRMSYLWLIVSQQNQISITTYAAIFPFFYYALSRGYFAQVLLDLMFVALSALITHKAIGIIRRIKLK